MADDTILKKELIQYINELKRQMSFGEDENSQARSFREEFFAVNIAGQSYSEKDFLELLKEKIRIKLATPLWLDSYASCLRWTALCRSPPQ